MTMKRTNKVKNWILVAAIVIFLVAIIGGTYSRYSSTGTVNSVADIAKWHVTLNASDISTASTTVNVSAVSRAGVSNTNVSTNKIAPGQTLIAEFTVDPTGSEVAIDYSMNVGTITATGFNSGSDIHVAKIQALVEGAENEVLTTLDNGTYKFSESLADVLAGKDVKFVVYITWTNSTDAVDTANAAIENVVVPVSITAEQKV